ncbi:hypothetical protein EV363DRAFT_1446629 [Boletus edulis]|nr:hypothetical protein EV363DRAFT_1446629 [Boletus edulis]
MQSWEDFALDPQYDSLSGTLEGGLKNLSKWYHSTEESDAYFLSMVLDPTIKLAYIKKKWAQSDYQNGLKKFEAVFNGYY